MMTCERCRSLLGLYHDGMLAEGGAADVEAVQAHLATCSACAAVLETYRDQDTRITAALAVTASPRFRGAVLAATTERVPGRLGSGPIGGIPKRPAAGWRSSPSRLAGSPATAPRPSSGIPLERRRDRAPGTPASRYPGQLVLGTLAGVGVAGLLVVLLLAAGSTMRSGHHPNQLAGPVQAHETAIAFLTGLNASPSQGRTGATGKASPASGYPALPTRGIVASHSPLTSGIPAIGPEPNRPGTRSAGTHLSVASRSALLATRVPSRGHTPKMGLTQPVDRAALLRLAPETVLTTQEIHKPLWSHDSSSLLYLTDFVVAPTSGWYAGTLMRFAPSGTLELGRQVRDFDWSPDDQSLVYTSQSSNSAGGSALLAGPEQLHRVAADGTGDRVLAGVDRTNVEWLAGGIIAVQGGTVVRIDPQSGDATPLSRMPALSVADEDSAFSALSGNERFFAYQDGSGLRVWDRTQHALLILRQPLARHNVASFHFSWDGNTIFYSTYDGQHAMLWRQSLAPLGSPVKLDTNQPVPGPIDLVGPPSPDGSIVNFGVGSGAAARNYLIAAGSGQPHALLPPGGVGPVGWWSPDGRHLVYIIYHGDQPVLSGIARVQS